MASGLDELSSEMKAVKLLLILHLLKSGVKQSQIAAMLGISEATMSRMLPTGLSKSLSRQSGAE